jgi:hypothetical protein
MGTMTDAKIRAWQAAAGIEPAEGARAQALDRMSDLAHQLIEVIALERSGIRHGDGHWHGFNPVDMTLVELHATWLVLNRKPNLELTHNGKETPF